MNLDPWQIEVLDTSGNICLRSGRQVGKTEVISRKAAEYARKNPNKLVMVIASVERQATLLFDRTMNYLDDYYRDEIAGGSLKPTKHIINLTNGSRIMCLPCGLDGHGIRGFTIDMLIVDEAAFVPEAVFTSIIPALLVTKGSIILLSTPHGREGFYYSCFSDPNFKSFHISSLDCPRADKEFLERERKRMTKMQFAQEYEGQFVDELRQFFPTELIQSCMTLQENSSLSLTSFQYNFPGDNFLGVDVAARGLDETVLISVRRTGEKIRMLDMEVKNHNLITETVKMINIADKKYAYNKIFVDSGGLGVGVVDGLREIDSLKRKIVEVNNASRSLDNDNKKHARLMKEDLYMNLLRLMEQGKIAIFNNPEILLSLKSIQYEYDGGKLKVWGSYDHITEALIRAVHCMRNKSLNIWYISK